MLFSLSRRLLPWLRLAPCVSTAPHLLHRSSLPITATASSQPLALLHAAILQLLTGRTHAPSVSPFEPSHHARHWHFTCHTPPAAFPFLSTQHTIQLGSILAASTAAQTCLLSSPGGQPRSTGGFSLATTARTQQPHSVRSFSSRRQFTQKKKPLPTWLHILRRKRKAREKARTLAAVARRAKRDGTMATPRALKAATLTALRAAPVWPVTGGGDAGAGAEQQAASTGTEKLSEGQAPQRAAPVWPITGADQQSSFTGAEQQAGPAGAEKTEGQATQRAAPVWPGTGGGAEQLGGPTGADMFQGMATGEAVTGGAGTRHHVPPPSLDVSMSAFTESSSPDVETSHPAFSQDSPSSHPPAPNPHTFSPSSSSSSSSSSSRSSSANIAQPRKSQGRGGSSSGRVWPMDPPELTLTISRCASFKGLAQVLNISAEDSPATHTERSNSRTQDDQESTPGLRLRAARLSLRREARVLDVQKQGRLRPGRRPSSMGIILTAAINQAAWLDTHRPPGSKIESKSGQEKALKQALLGWISPQLVEAAPVLDARGVSTILNAFGRMRLHPSQDVWDSLMARLTEPMPPKRARKQAGSPGLRNAASSQDSAALVDTLSSKEIIDLAAGLARLRAGSSELWTRLLETAAARAVQQEVSPEHLPLLLWYFQEGGVRARGLGQHGGDISEGGVSRASGRSWEGGMEGRRSSSSSLSGGGILDGGVGRTEGGNWEGDVEGARRSSISGGGSGVGDYGVERSPSSDAATSMQGKGRRSLFGGCGQERTGGMWQEGWDGSAGSSEHSESGHLDAWAGSMSSTSQQQESSTESSGSGRSDAVAGSMSSTTQGQEGSTEISEHRESGHLDAGVDSMSSTPQGQESSTESRSGSRGQEDSDSEVEDGDSSRESSSSDSETDESDKSSSSSEDDEADVGSSHRGSQLRDDSARPPQSPGMLHSHDQMAAAQQQALHELVAALPNLAPKMDLQGVALSADALRQLGIKPDQATLHVLCRRARFLLSKRKQQQEQQQLQAQLQGQLRNVAAGVLLKRRAGAGPASAHGASSMSGSTAHGSTGPLPISIGGSTDQRRHPYPEAETKEERRQHLRRVQLLRKALRAWRIQDSKLWALLSAQER